MAPPVGYHYAGMSPESPNPISAGFTSAISDMYSMHSRGQMNAYQAAQSHSQNSMARNFMHGAGVGNYGVMGGQQAGAAAFNKDFGVMASGTMMYGGAIVGGAGLIAAGTALTGIGSGGLIGRGVQTAVRTFAGSRVAGLAGGAASLMGWGMPISLGLSAIAKPVMQRVSERAEIAADLTSMSGRMSGGFGAAFNESTIKDIASGMAQDLRSDKFFDADQSKSIGKIGMASGLLKGRGKDEFLRNFKDLKEAAKDVMMMLNTTVEGGMSVMADVKKMGISDPKQIRNYVAQSRAAGNASGLGTGVMMQYGAAGGEMVRGTGISMGLGAGVMQRSVVGAQQALSLDPGMKEYYAQVGGSAQAGQTIARSQMSVLTSGMGTLALGAVYDVKTGKADSGAMDRLLSGEMSSKEMRYRANKMFANEDDRAEFFLNAPKMLGKMDPREISKATRGVFKAWAADRKRDPSSKAAGIKFAQLYSGAVGGQGAGGSVANVGILANWLNNPDDDVLLDNVMAQQRRKQQMQLIRAKRPGFWGRTFPGASAALRNMGADRDDILQGMAEGIGGASNRIGNIVGGVFMGDYDVDQVNNDLSRASVTAISSNVMKRMSSSVPANAGDWMKTLGRKKAFSKMQSISGTLGFGSLATKEGRESVYNKLQKGSFGTSEGMKDLRSLSIEDFDKAYLNVGATGDDALNAALSNLGVLKGGGVDVKDLSRRDLLHTGPGWLEQVRKEMLASNKDKKDKDAIKSMTMDTIKAIALRGEAGSVFEVEAAKMWSTKERFLYTGAGKEISERIGKIESFTGGTSMDLVFDLEEGLTRTKKTTNELMGDMFIRETGGGGGVLSDFLFKKRKSFSGFRKSSFLTIRKEARLAAEGINKEGMGVKEIRAAKIAGIKGALGRIGGVDNRVGSGFIEGRGDEIASALLDEMTQEDDLGGVKGISAVTNWAASTDKYKPLAKLSPKKLGNLRFDIYEGKKSIKKMAGDLPGIDASMVKGLKGYMERDLVSEGRVSKAWEPIKFDKEKKAIEGTGESTEMTTAIYTKKIYELVQSGVGDANMRNVAPGSGSGQIIG